MIRGFFHTGRRRGQPDANLRRPFSDRNHVVKLTESQRKNLRRLGHGLNPVVMIGAAGLSDAVLEEAEGALDHHELVKIKVRVGDRTERDEIISRLCEATGAELVQRVGHMALVYRANPERKRINPNASA
jgi:RNA-binding protein